MVMEMVFYFDLSYTLRFNMMVLFLLLNESMFMDSEWRHGQVLKSIWTFKHCVLQNKISCCWNSWCSLFASCISQFLLWQSGTKNCNWTITVSGERLRDVKIMQEKQLIHFIFPWQFELCLLSMTGVSRKSQYSEVCSKLIESLDM